MNSSGEPSTEPDPPRLFSIIRGGRAAPEDPSDAAGRPDGEDPTGSRPTAPPSPDRTDVDGSDRHGGTSGVEYGTGAVSSSEEETTEARGEAERADDDAAAEVEDLSDAEGQDAIVAQALALLDDADPLTYYRALRSLVREGHSNVLVPLEYSAELEYHDPTRVSIEASPTNLETALLYARAAYPDFDSLLVAGFSDPARSDLLEAIFDLLVIENRNIAIVTNHGQIIDIALVLAALFAAVLAPDRSFGVLGESLSLKDLAARSNTLVSRMVVTRQAFGIPAIAVLESITRIFLSVPQTASRRRAKLDPSLVNANNTLMRHELKQRLAGGGQLVAMAASGTQDLTIPQLMSRARTAWRHRRGDDPGEEPTLHLQPLYNGTIALMRACDYVLPVAVSLESKCPALRIGALTRTREDEDCHRIMDWIALAHQDATGVPTIYHRPGDDLLTQVRSLINR